MDRSQVRHCQITRAVFYDRRASFRSRPAHGTDTFFLDAVLPRPAVDGPPGLLQLPLELLDAILRFLSPVSLAIARRVCKKLHVHADADFHWQRHVQANLPGNPITTAYPFRTFRELYACHDPYWFIPRNKVWFCDRGLTGQMIVAQYDQRRGVIEGYQILAVRDRETSEPWLADAEVHIHYFDPQVKLHRDKPVIQFNPPSREDLAPVNWSTGNPGVPRKHSIFSELPMRISQGTDPRLSNVILAKPLTEDMTRDTLSAEWPYGFVWPPPTIPAHHRVGAQASGIMPLPTHRLTRASPSVWKPASRSEISDQAFRVRQWMEMGPPTLGLHVGEEIVTYSTLDPKLYTPTKEKPWRGIWVGDYSGHGCEFLLLNQPDCEGDDQPLERATEETDAEFEERFRRERLYRGRLEAIKLTGDPNVPRGEYTFIAKDLGEDGFIGVAHDPPFRGARVVKSKGHIANMGFYNGKCLGASDGPRGNC